MHREHVGVTLDQVAAILFNDCLARLEDAIDDAALMIDLGLGGVDVFGCLRVCLYYSSAETQHLP